MTWVQTPPGNSRSSRKHPGRIRRRRTVLCGRPLVGQWRRAASGPPDGREQPSAWHTTPQLLVRRHAASARRFVGALLAPTPSRPRRAGRGNGAARQRGGSAATRRPARFCGWDEHGEHPPVAPFEHRGTCPLSSWHRRHPRNAASSRARPATDDHGCAGRTGLRHGAALAATAPCAVCRRTLGNSGQSRSYVRPVSRCLPLAIMGVRLRARHHSVRRARSTRHLSVLPGLS